MNTQSLMIRRITPWLCTVVVSWSFGFWFNQQFPTPDGQWLRWLYEHKKERLISSRGKPRLIILGGSGTFFGIDSELLEKQLGFTVVNAGVHAGLGLNATLNLFIQEIQSGDQVVIIPEYGMLVNPNGVGELSSMLGGAISRPTLGARTPLQVLEEGLAAGRPGLTSIAFTLNRITGSTQHQKGYDQLMNRYGDAQQIPEGQFSVAPVWRSGRQNPSPHGLNQLRSFRQQVEEKGGQLTIALPWLLAKPEPENKFQIQQDLQVLQEIAPVLFNSETLNAQSDVSLFSDTAYHLSVKGRRIRTQELAEQLKVRLQP